MRAALVRVTISEYFCIPQKPSDRPGEESAAVYLARASRREHFLALTNGLLNRLVVGLSWRV